MLGILALVLVLAGSALLFAGQWLFYGLEGADWLASEAMVLVAVALVLPAKRVTRLVIGMGTVVLAVGAWYRLAQLAVVQALGRPINLVTDTGFLSLGYDLLAEDIGAAVTIALLVLAALLTLLLIMAFSLGYRRLLPASRPGALRMVAAAALLAVAIGGARLNRSYGDIPIAAPLVHAAFAQATRIQQTLTEREQFIAELKRTDAGTRAMPLSALAGKDVIIAFVESYGEVVLQKPEFQRVAQPALKRLQAAVAEAGLDAVSGRLKAPTAGGQSWLAHGTLLSGRWLTNQLRYDLMLQSPAATLIDDFARTGHRTMTIAPAITEPWPQGKLFGYDRILGRDALDYAGPRFNWVTMPDQYTWRYLAGLQASADSTALFVEMALISSHAPWTPILPVIDDWSRIDDGSIFNRWAGKGETPRSLWQDMARVREHYVKSIAYALRIAAGYTRRFVGEDTLLIILGDHPPAPIIAGRGASDAVPVHIVSGDPALLKPFRQHGFIPGLQPPKSGEAPPMDAFRGWMIRGFGASQ